MTSISFPFRIDAHGKVADTRDPQKVRLDRVRAVVNTQLGDRVNRPDFGLDSSDFLMGLERMSQLTVDDRVKRAFTSCIPDISLVSAKVVVDPEDTQTRRVDVRFTGPGGDTEYLPAELLYNASSLSDGTQATSDDDFFRDTGIMADPGEGITDEHQFKENA